MTSIVEIILSPIVRHNSAAAVRAHAGEMTRLTSYQRDLQSSLLKQICSFNNLELSWIQ